MRMSLPHFTNSKASLNYSIVYKNLYEVQFSTTDITEQECKILTENCCKIEKNILHFNVNVYGETSIQVFDILNRLNKFSLTVLVHNKQSDIIGKFIYSDCVFNQKVESMVDFDWASSDILTPKFELIYKNLEYIDGKDFKSHLRGKKIERLIIDKPTGK